MNKVVLIGRLTKEPDLKFTTGGVAVTTFSLAVDRNYTGADGKREADFINIVCWRKVAENAANNLQKGRLIALSGNIQTRKYQAQDGSNRYVTEVIADDIKYLDYPKTSGSAGTTSASENAFSNRNFDNGGFVPVMGDDDVPF